MKPILTKEQRLRRIAELINKGIYLYAVKEGWSVQSDESKKETHSLELSTEETQVVQLCTQNGKITSNEIQDLLGVHRNTAMLKLKNMVATGILSKKGNGRHTFYILNQVR